MFDSLQFHHDYTGLEGFSSKHFSWNTQTNISMPEGEGMYLCFEYGLTCLPLPSGQPPPTERKFLLLGGPKNGVFTGACKGMCGPVLGAFTLLSLEEVLAAYT